MKAKNEVHSQNQMYRHHLVFYPCEATHDSLHFYAKQYRAITRFIFLSKSYC